MPAALIIGHHFSISALWCAPSASGVSCSRVGMTWPSSVSHARPPGSATVSPPAALSGATTSRGFPAGAHKPYQNVMCSPGAPGLHMTFWYGLWAPAGKPRDVVAPLNAAGGETVADPGGRAWLTEEGHVIPTREQLTPEALGAHHKAEIEKWWPMIKAAGIKIQ